MKKSKKSLDCIQCGQPALSKLIKKSFLLFPKFTCGNCGKKNLYPASTGAQVLHWVIVLIFIGGLASGTVMVPGFIFIAGFWGISANNKIQKEHRKKRFIPALNICEQSSEWYYLSGDQSVGPLGEGGIRDALQSNLIDLDVMVWRDGMKDWLPLRSFEELRTFPYHVMPLGQASIGNKGDEINVPQNTASAPTDEIESSRNKRRKAKRVNRNVGLLVGSVLLIFVAIVFGRSSGKNDDRRTAEKQFEKDPVGNTAKVTEDHQRTHGFLEESYADFVPIDKGGLEISVPKRLSSLTVERDSGTGIKLLEKYTCVWVTRSIAIKHFVFETSRIVSAQEASDMTESEIKSQPGFSATRKSVMVSGVDGVILNAQYIGMGQKVEHSILHFSRGNELWEIQLFGVNDKQPRALKEMKDKVFSSIEIKSKPQGSSKIFCSEYGVSLRLPEMWVLDRSQVRKDKVKLAQLLTSTKQDGKVRILNTGTAPGSQDGYARLRLSVTSDTQLSQDETRELSEDDLAVIKKRMQTELAKNTIFSCDLESVAVSKTRANNDYWSYRISYVRSGLNGPVRVEQYYVPFSNRAILLTLSYQLSKAETLAPILLRIWSSLELNDAILWPKS